jgi:hypothetical protein
MDKNIDIALVLADLIHRRFDSSRIPKIDVDSRNTVISAASNASRVYIEGDYLGTGFSQACAQGVANFTASTRDDSHFS